MLVYRIVHKNFSQSLQPSGMKGRWNSEGNKVVYCSESIALAFLESMIRRQGVGFNHDFKIMFIQVPDKAKITSVKIEDLNAGWRADFAYSKCREIGDNWYKFSKTLLLKVPSAVLPEQFNFVINSLHKDFNKVKLIEVTNLVPDERVEEILKKYGAR